MSLALLDASMVRSLIAALGMAALAGGPAAAGDRSHLSLFPGYLYLLPPPMIHPAPAAGIDFVAPTNIR